MTNIPLLDTINIPSDIKKLSIGQLPQLAAEVRTCFMDNIAQTGGHFASNLGVVELTIALHYVFDAPLDHIVWDVGHQAYIHKMLTGRKNQLHTLRQKDGLAPFPKRSESEYDDFGVGHSSTSIGAALGMAVADQLQGKNHHAIAIIGDGAMTAGQAFEALNCAGEMQDINLLVILNDNEMSISKNVGALPTFLARQVMHDVKDIVKSIKHSSEKVLDILPGATDVARKVENKVKEVMYSTASAISLFNNFGFHYTGPEDGHNISKLIDTLERLKQKTGPRLLHIQTQKGKGFKPAEDDPIAFHAVSTFDSANPPTIAKPTVNVPPSYTEVFSQWIVDQAKIDDRLIAITPAMREGSGLVDFEKSFPQRYFDVGIAEQHALTFAAGLACEGLKPVVAIYSTFLQRAYDQLIHDIALQNLPVLFAIDRAGIVGADGATHAGLYDLSFLRCVPNMVIAAPSNEAECRLLLATCYQLDQPSAVRYPRGKGIGVSIANNLDTVEVGKAVLRRQGEKIAIMAFGSMLEPALTIADELNATVIDMRFIKPLDEEMVQSIALNHDYIVTIEENTILGGAGSAILEYLSQQRILKPVLTLGIPDVVTQHGDPKVLLTDLHLDPNSLLQRVKDFIKD